MVLLSQTLGDGAELTLSERVDELLRAHEGRLLSTTGTQAAICELATRAEGLERAIREIALEVQNLRASREPGPVFT